MKILTPNNKGRNARVWLNFKEITHQCFHAEVTNRPGIRWGKVGVFPRDEDGNFQLDFEAYGGSEIKREYRTGLIIWKRISRD